VYSASTWVKAASAATTAPARAPPEPGCYTSAAMNRPGPRFVPVVRRSPALMPGGDDATTPAYSWLATSPDL